MLKAFNLIKNSPLAGDDNNMFFVCVIVNDTKKILFFVLKSLKTWIKWGVPDHAVQPVSFTRLFEFLGRLLERDPWVGIESLS